MINSSKFSNILLCLIPLALLTGPFIPDLFLSIICILFLFSLSKREIVGYFENRFFLISLSFFIVLIFTSLLSKDIIFSLKSTFFYFRFFLFSFAIWSLMDKDNNLIKYFFYALMFTYLFAIADGYYQYFFNSTFFGIKIEGVRLSLPFNDKLILGGYLVRFFPLLVGLYIYCTKKSFKNYIFLTLLFILSDLLIFITGERTALGLMTLATISIIIFIPEYRIMRITTFIFSIIFIVIISLSNNEIKERNLDLTMQQIGIEAESERIYIFSPEHDSLLRSATSMFIDSPYYGQGPNIFRLLCDKDKYSYNIYSCSTHPHNSYVQLLSETGIIGLSFLVLFFVFICIGLIHYLFIYYFRKTRVLSSIQVCIYISIMLSIWPIFPTLNFFNNWINIIHYIPIGFFLYFRYSRNLNKFD